jgi:CrcB protein
VFRGSTSSDRIVTPPLWAGVLAVATGGAVGATLRYLVGVAIVRCHPEAGPLGTFAVNIAGCFLIGLLMPLAERQSLPPLATLLLVTGTLGALTTFSTFGHETILLATVRHRPDLALANIASSLLTGLAAVWLGRTVLSRLLGNPD